MKLYELTQEYNQLQQLINDPDASLEIIQEVLGGLHEQIEVKAENIAKLIKSMDGDIEALVNEEKRLQANRKALENKKDNIKRYLQDQLEAVGLAKVKTPLFSIGIQNNPPKVVLEDERMICEDYIYTETKIDMKAIKDDLKAGKEVPGAKLVQERILRIR